MQHRLLSTQSLSRKAEYRGPTWVSPGPRLQEAGLHPARRPHPYTPALWSSPPLVPFKAKQLSSHVQPHHFFLLQGDNPHTEIQAVQTYSPSCVSRGISTSQAPVQILYKKFPLSSKNSRPRCTTLLLKFWSPGCPASHSCSFFSVGSPPLSAPLVAS